MEKAKISSPTGTSNCPSINEIAEITAAISAIRNGGQSYTIGTGPSSRTVTLADYDTLVSERRDLQAQLSALQGTSGLTIGAGW